MTGKEAVCGEAHAGPLGIEATVHAGCWLGAPLHCLLAAAGCRPWAPGSFPWGGAPGEWPGQWPVSWLRSTSFAGVWGWRCRVLFAGHTGAEGPSLSNREVTRDPVPGAQESHPGANVSWGAAPPHPLREPEGAPALPLSRPGTPGGEVTGAVSLGLTVSPGLAVWGPGDLLISYLQSEGRSGIFLNGLNHIITFVNYFPRT